MGVSALPMLLARLALREQYRWADHWGVKFELPSVFPQNTLLPLRIVLQIDRDRIVGRHERREDRREQDKCESRQADAQRPVLPSEEVPVEGEARAFGLGDLDRLDVVAQPIDFPHDKHAGPASQVPCMYCHYTADRSDDAGIPAVQVCVGCHMPGGVAMVRKDSTGVQQLAEYWSEQRPIPWVRIHKVPDYVQFPHMRHVNAGVTCQACHGPIQEMGAPVYQAESLNMGWCIKCHLGETDPQFRARYDCAVCHY